MCPKYPELRVGRILYTSAHLNVIAVNANGIRTARKKRLLRKLLRDLQVGLGIITETHLREEDLEGLRFRGYYRPAEYCRETEAGRGIRGGVLILAHNRFSTGKLPKLQGILPTMEHCSCVLFPTDSPVTAIRVSGVYMPPSRTKDLSLTELQTLSRAVENPAVGDAYPHLIAGDFNSTSWMALFTEWTQSEGLVELLHPELPTFAMGTSIDKFVFVPGFSSRQPF